jgi:hypothetical protein
VLNNFKPMCGTQVKLRRAKAKAESRGRWAHLTFCAGGYLALINTLL